MIDCFFNTCARLNFGTPTLSYLCLNHSKVIVFADDTTIFSSSKSIHSLYKNVNSDLAELSNWFRANKLALNVNKSNYMLFRSNATLDTHVGDILKIGPDKIEHKTSCKFLGIIIDNQLRWNDHINYINMKISRSVYILKSVKHVLPSKLLKTLLYNGTAVSYIWHHFVGFDLPMLY